MAFSRTVSVTHTKTLIAPDSGTADKVYGVDYVASNSHTGSGGVSGAVSGGIPFFDSTTTEATSALLAANSLVIGGGAGTAPFTSSLLTFSATGSVGGGPVLTVGSGATTTIGLTIETLGSGEAAIWTTGLTKSGSNYVLDAQISGGLLNTYHNVTGIGHLLVSNAGVMAWSVNGLYLGAGNGNLFIGKAAPTIASGFGASSSIVANNGTAAFTVNVGTGGAATGGVITMPTATTGWAAKVENLTAVAANRGDQRTVITATSATSITVQNQTISTGAALAWTASDVLQIMALGY